MARDQSNSRREFRRAKRLIPGGVNSPVRAYGSVGGTPPFIASAKGARVRDVDGHEYGLLNGLKLANAAVDVVPDAQAVHVSLRQHHVGR